MSETKNETTYQPMTFDAIKIGSGFPGENPGVVPEVRYKNLRQLTIEH